MKSGYRCFSSVLILLLIISCANLHPKSSDKSGFQIQEKASFVIEEIQFQPWTSEIKDEGSGYHIYISILENKNEVTFDRIYFKGYSAKIIVGKMGYFVTIQTLKNRKEDLIMSNNDREEYGNSPKILRNTKFDFGENTCVIKYIEKDQVFYFKYNQMTKKEL